MTVLSVKTQIQKRIHTPLFPQEFLRTREHRNILENPLPWGQTVRWVRVKALLRYTGAPSLTEGGIITKRLTGNRLNCSDLPRGRYRGQYGIDCSSPLGLNRCELILDQFLDLYIPPEPLKTDVPELSGSVRKSKSFREDPHSMELMESREYHPGDDPRRIHWKQAARTGRLFLRIDQSGVPRTERLHILLDCRTFPPKLERLLSSFEGLIEQLEQDEREMEVYLPAGSAKVCNNRRERQKILAALTGREKPPAIPSGGALLVFGPEERREEWDRKLRERNSLFQAPGEFFPQAGNWKDLFIRRDP